MDDNILINNFGPIKSANIDISPLTIFIGINGSGKSFSALLIHSMLNSFNKMSFDQVQDIKKRSLESFLDNDSEIFKKFKDSLSDYIKSKPKISDDAFKFPTNEFYFILEESFGKVYCDVVEDKLKGNFTNNLNKLNRLNKYPFEFDFNKTRFVNESNRLIIKNYSIDFNGMKDNLFNEDDEVFLLEINEDFLSINLNHVLWNKIVDNVNFFDKLVFILIISNLMNALNKNAYYLPASDELF